MENEEEQKTIPFELSQRQIMVFTWILFLIFLTYFVFILEVRFQQNEIKELENKLEFYEK